MTSKKEIKLTKLGSRIRITAYINAYVHGSESKNKKCRKWTRRWAVRLEELPSGT